MTKNKLFSLCFISFFMSNYYLRLLNIPIFIPFLALFLLIPFSINIKNNRLIFYLLLFFCSVATIIASFLSEEGDLTSAIKSQFSYIFMILLLLFFNNMMNSNWFNVKQFANCFYVATTTSFSVIIIIALTTDIYTSGYMKMRLDGGINSNILSFYALGSIYITFLLIVLTKNSCNSLISLISAFIVLIWTMSRTTIAVFLIMLLFLILIGIIRYILLNKIPRRAIFYTPLFFGIIIIFGGFFVLNYDSLALPLKNRLETENIGSREIAWSILYSYFEKSPIFGYSGWYNHITLLTESPGAKTAHSLYFRLLAEVGVIGIIAVLLVPIILLFYSFFIAIKNINNSITFYFYSVLALGTLGVLTRESFENSYMYNYMDLSTFLIIFNIALALNYKSITQHKAISK